MSPLLRRTGALVASSVLAVTGVTLIPAPAQAAGTDPRPLSIGADWLAGELVNGLLPGDFGPLYGTSIDAALSLKLAGGHMADVDAVGAAIASQVKAYTEFAYDYDSDFPADGITEHYEGQSAGGTAKALVLGQALSTPTTTMDGIDLVARLKSFVATTAPIEGRLVGLSTKDGADDPASEYTNVVGQALGVAGLFAAGADEADPALTFLLKQQCAAGYFRLDFNFDKTAEDQTCDGANPQFSPADPDVTAQVVRLLQPQAAGNATVETALEKAEDWLIARQLPDGSFIGGTSTAVPNANSTGLIGGALGLRGETAAATKAAIWVRAHQADELTACANALSTETGAIAYNDQALATGRATGIGSGAQQWRIAAAQALPVLAYAPSGTPAIAIAGPTGFIKGGSTATYTVSGVVPGDKVCLNAVGSNRSLSAGAAGTVTTRVTFPAATAKRIVTVKDRGNNSASIQAVVLGARTFRVVASKAVVTIGRRVTVTVSGLAPAEPVIVNLRGVRKRAGVAGPNGVFTGTFIVTGAPGKASVTALGAFPAIRRGTTSIKLVR